MNIKTVFSVHWMILRTVGITLLGLKRQRRTFQEGYRRSRHQNRTWSPVTHVGSTAGWWTIQLQKATSERLIKQKNALEWPSQSLDFKSSSETEVRTESRVLLKTFLSGDDKDASAGSFVVTFRGYLLRISPSFFPLVNKNHYFHTAFWIYIITFVKIKR